MGHVSHPRQRRQVGFLSINFGTLLTGISLRCIQVIAGVLGRAGEAGQKQRLAAAARGEITYRPATGLVVAEGEEGEETAATHSMEKNSSRARRPTADVDSRGIEGSREPAPFEDIMDTDELSTKLDEVNNGEDHRLKGGRELKATS
jgi:small subunit ribosomal protein S2